MSNDSKKQTYMATFGVTLQAYGDFLFMESSPQAALDRMKKELARPDGPSVTFKPRWEELDNPRLVVLMEKRSGTVIAENVESETCAQVIVGAYSEGEVDRSPEFASFTLYDAMKRRVEALTVLCREHRLSLVICEGAADWGVPDYEEEAQLREHRVEVREDGSFRFIARPKGGDEVSTVLVTIAEIEAAFAQNPGEPKVFIDKPHGGLRKSYEILIAEAAASATA